MKLSHLRQSATIDISESSLHSTTVVCWRSGISRVIEPVLSGIRLALVYSIFDTGGMPGPSSVRSHNHLDNLFKEWSQTIFSGPKRVVHLLQESYSPSNLDANVLTGSDYLKVQALHPVTATYGFRLMLGTLVHNAFGTCNDDYDGIHPKAEIGRTTHIVSISNLDGDILCQEIILPDTPPSGSEAEYIPSDLRGALECDAPLKEGMRDSVSASESV